MTKGGQQRRLLGMVMLETGMVSTDQLIEILKYFDTADEAGRRPAESPTD